MPHPNLIGAHQADNAALAIAMLRHQDFVTVSARAMANGLTTARWPGRLQRLTGTLIAAREVWLDGGHNRSAAEALASHFKGRPLHLITGMIANKDPAAFIEPLTGILATVTVVPVPGQDHHDANGFPTATSSAIDVAQALNALPDDDLPVLIAGSLYLAGEVLAGERSDSRLSSGSLLPAVVGEPIRATRAHSIMHSATATKPINVVRMKTS